tara:strand:- start:116 stop:403 length:288 start_codon:yes stop_codon:yes gene_type:complete
MQIDSTVQGKSIKDLEIKSLEDAQSYLDRYNKDMITLSDSQLKKLKKYIKNQQKKVGMLTRSPDVETAREENMKYGGKMYAKGGGVRKAQMGDYE